MNITIYTKPGCPSCDSLKTYLKAHNYQYSEKVLNVDLTKEELVELFPGAMTVPQVMINEVPTGGYSSTVQFLTESKVA